MSDMNIPTVSKRHAWVAAILSLLLPGLGHIYCGALARGLLLACLSALCILLAGVLIANQVPASPLGLALAAVLGLFVVTVISIIDGCRLARRAPQGYELREYNRLAVYLLLLLMGKGATLGAFLYTRDHLIEAFIIPTASMAPTIEPGDRVFANKTAYEVFDPRRGDVIIFRDAENWRARFVKRIVAVAGDTIEINAGRLILNGQELEHQPLPDVPRPASGPQGTVCQEINGSARYPILEAAAERRIERNLPTLKIPPYHCFVLGDNRSDSKDSRELGPIPLTSIIARADYLYWPARGWSRFGSLNY